MKQGHSVIESSIIDLNQGQIVRSVNVINEEIITAIQLKSYLARRGTGQNLLNTYEQKTRDLGDDHNQVQLQFSTVKNSKGKMSYPPRYRVCRLSV